MKHLCTIFFVLYVSVGCAQSRREKEVIRAIEAVESQLASHEMKREVDELLHLYGGDAILIEPQKGELVDNPEKVAAMWEPVRKGTASLLDEHFEMDDIQVLNDHFAVEVGRVVTTESVGDAKKVFQNRYLTVWKKYDEGWKIFRDMWLRMPPPRVKTVLAPEFYQSLEGRYRRDASTIITVKAAGDKLMYAVNDGPALELLSENANLFFFERISALVTFIRAQDGTATHLIVSRGQDNLTQATRIE